jgi:transcriptional regulator with XRE-family HTH domain
VVDALRMQTEDLEREISEYEDLKEGRLLSFGADDLDSLGELLTKVRIARGLAQAERGALLGMTQQHVQRYERDGWQKISLWRLAEAAGALGLEVNIRARLPASNIARAAGVGKRERSPRRTHVQQLFGVCRRRWREQDAKHSSPSRRRGSERRIFSPAQKPTSGSGCALPSDFACTSARSKPKARTQACTRAIACTPRKPPASDQTPGARELKKGRVR